MLARLVLAVMFCLALSPRSALASDLGQDFPADDKAAHFGISALGTATTLKIFEFYTEDRQVTYSARIISSLLWVGIGAWKELYDQRVKNKDFDFGDMGADAFGIVYGNILMINF